MALHFLAQKAVSAGNTQLEAGLCGNLEACPSTPGTQDTVVAGSHFDSNNITSEVVNSNIFCCFPTLPCFNLSLRSYIFILLLFYFLPGSEHHDSRDFILFTAALGRKHLNQRLGCRRKADIFAQQMKDCQKHWPVMSLLLRIF